MLVVVGTRTFLRFLPLAPAPIDWGSSETSLQRFVQKIGEARAGQGNTLFRKT
jgi:hypothetical protein